MRLPDPLSPHCGPPRELLVVPLSERPFDERPHFVDAGRAERSHGTRTIQPFIDLVHLLVGRVPRRRPWRVRVNAVVMEPGSDLGSIHRRLRPGTPVTAPASSTSQISTLDVDDSHVRVGRAAVASAMGGLSGEALRLVDQRPVAVDVLGCAHRQLSHVNDVPAVHRHLDVAGDDRLLR
jgi:hypothetical protein